jgi:xylan 1,4-beta-xylosidase
MIRTRILSSVLAAAASLTITVAAVAQTTLTLDADAPTTPFPHFWEQTFGSGRAILSLRDSYRTDLRAVKGATGFESVRFHGILNDEVGLNDPDRRARRALRSMAASTTSPTSTRSMTACSPTISAPSLS